MLNLFDMKAQVLLQLLIPFVTWSVVNVAAEVNAGFPLDLSRY